MWKKEKLLLFPQCFLLNQKIESPFVDTFGIISLFAAELEDPKIDILCKGLNTYTSSRPNPMLWALIGILSMRQTQDYVTQCLTLYHTIPSFNNPEKEAL